jgi:chromate reductase
MAEVVNILGIAGSLRRDSYNRAVLMSSLGLVPENSRIDVFDELGQIPLFNQDQERTPPALVADFKTKIRMADAILFVTPEYNYSVPGVLKNAIDWASRPYGDSAWEGKPVAVMGASIGLLGTVRAQMHLRQMFVYLDMYPVNKPEVMITNAPQRFAADGSLVDETIREHIGELLRNLVELSQRLARAQAASAA